MSDFKKISNIIKPFEVERNKYVTREFQDYGYQLAEELGDLKHKALYIKLAKTMPRGILEAARNFVADASLARSKPKLFMWKLKQLRSKDKKASK